MRIGNENLYTTEEAARQLGRKVKTVRVYASRLNIGRMIGGVRFLSDDDLAMIRSAKAGGDRRKKENSTETPHDEH